MLFLRLFLILLIIGPGVISAKEQNLKEQLLEHDFIALLKKGSIVVDSKTNKQLVVPKNIEVKAREREFGGKYSDIYTKDGVLKYHTLTSNLSSLEPDKKLAPQVDHLNVYDYSDDLIHYDKDIQLLSFFNYQLSFINTDYYAEVYRGTTTSAVENQFGTKVYFSHPNMFIDFGVAASIHRGFWGDNIGTITWNSLLIGPSIHTTLWEAEKGALHLHLSAMKSLYHEATFDPDTTKFSTNLFKMEISQSYKTKLASFYLGGVIEFMQTSFKESTEFINTQGKRDSMFGVGATIGIMKPWTL